MLDLWGIASITSKFMLYLGLLTSVGTVYSAMLFQLTDYRRFAFVFATLGIVATLLNFLLVGASLTGDASGMLDWEILSLLWVTPIGTTLVLRVIGLGLLIFGIFLKRVGLVIAVFGGTCALWSFANVGHILDRDSLGLSFILMLHLVSISIWIGVLSPLRRLSLDMTRLSDAAYLGRRFGDIATMFVPLLILAGGYMSYVFAGSVSALLDSRYGQFLIIKVFLVVLLMGLAATNKLRFIPLMEAGDKNSSNRLAKSISFEWTIVIVILFITAILTSVLTLPATGF